MAAQKKVGIVGGGRVGLEMFNLFTRSSLAEVAYVVDINPSAPGIVAARQAGIATYNAVEQVIQLPVDFILEVTRSDEVFQMLAQKLNGSRTRLITHDMASLILLVIEESDRRSRQGVMGDVNQIQHKMKESLQTVETLVQDIESVTSEMRMLALNAQIEAARAGEYGKGFAVVAQYMATSVDSVRDIAVQIDNVNKTLHNAVGEIETAVDRLK